MTQNLIPPPPWECLNPPLSPSLSLRNIHPPPGGPASTLHKIRQLLKGFSSIDRRPRHSNVQHANKSPPPPPLPPPPPPGGREAPIPICNPGWNFQLSLVSTYNRLMELRTLGGANFVGPNSIKNANTFSSTLRLVSFVYSRIKKKSRTAWQGKSRYPQP